MVVKKRTNSFTWGGDAEYACHMQGKGETDNEKGDQKSGRLGTSAECDTVQDQRSE